MTLKWCQRHQTWYELLGPMQGNNHAKFQRPPLNSVHQKANRKILSNQKTCQLSSLNMCQSEKYWYIHYLLDLLNDPTKFKHSWIRTQNFHLKLFDTAVTLKYGQGHWKWYEQVKLNEEYHHAKFDIYYIHGVWENPNVKVFDKPRHVTDQKTCKLSPLNTHISVAQFI